MEAEEREYEAVFEIISYSGDARGLAMEAIKRAQEGRFEEAKERLGEAEATLNEAHDKLFDLVTQEAQGDKISVNILLVHAQDHLTLATIAIDQAQLALDLYHQISELKNKKGETEG